MNCFGDAILSGGHGLRLLNISHTGKLRLIRGGFLDERIGTFVRHDLADRMKLSGEEPIDWILSKAVDDYCTVLFSEDELAPTYQKAREEYHAGLLKRMAEKPKALVEENQRMGGKLQQFTEKFEKERIKVADLEARVRELEAEKDALQQQSAKAVKSTEPPSLPTDILSLSLRQRLKGYFPDELLFNCSNFSDLTGVFLIQEPSEARKRLSELAEDPGMPITAEERAIARADLEGSRRMGKGGSRTSPGAIMGSLEKAPLKRKNIDEKEIMFPKKITWHCSPLF